MLVTQINKRDLDDVLNKITEVLDITDYQYEEAIKRYKAVGEFLGDCPRISEYDPEVFPQGSFRLGTVVRPLLEGEEYDIDLVCQLKATHIDFTQKELKNLIGDRLKEPRYVNQLKPENRRSWTLKYHESSKFHLDILPVIPDNDSRVYLTGLGNPKEYANEAISITDNTKYNYDTYSYDWKKSNPKGYSEWFKNQMITSLNENKRMFAGLKGIQVDEVPFYKIKTPLQRAIQILKRHRDVIFGDDEDKPISIIITTLSARAYNNQNSVYDALSAILKDMDTYITNDDHGNDKVENPVDSRENFADKWEQYPKRRENFYSWLDRARMDFETILDKTNMKDLKESLELSLGENVVTKVLNENKLLPNLASTQLSMRNPYAIDYSPSEEFIQEEYSVNLNYNLKINCRVNQSGYRPTLLRDLYILKKNHSLKFFIQKNEVPKPYEVKWKVRNCGVKAKRHGVRGGILNDDGSETRVENSSFYGKHFVECYIIKNHTCVAMDRIDVPISGILN
tara:strand:+ start:12353 stop:13882 length:1530 start_codon:yes stop_codon:yes gene_type:complete